MGLGNKKIIDGAYHELLDLRLEEETLSDGSKVYNLLLRNQWQGKEWHKECDNEKQATELFLKIRAAIDIIGFNFEPYE